MKTLLSAVLVLAALLIAHPSAAQTPTPQPERAAFAPYIVLIAGNVADLWTTKRVLDTGGHESNGLYGSSDFGRIVFQKSLITGTLVVVMHTFETHGHPRIAKVLGYVDGGVMLGAAWHNAGQVR